MGDKEDSEVIPKMQRIEFKGKDPRETPRTVHAYLCDGKCSECILVEGEYEKSKEYHDNVYCYSCRLKVRAVRNFDFFGDSRLHCTMCEGKIGEEEDIWGVPVPVLDQCVDFCNFCNTYLTLGAMSKIFDDPQDKGCPFQMSTHMWSKLNEYCYGELVIFKDYMSWISRLDPHNRRKIWYWYISNKDKEPKDVHKVESIKIIAPKTYIKEWASDN